MAASYANIENFEKLFPVDLNQRLHDQPVLPLQHTLTP